MFPDSYLLNQVVEIINEIQSSIKLKITNRNRHGFGRTPTGCKVKFGDTGYSLSIQTDPIVSGSAFCETALSLNDEFANDFGYDDTVIRHPTPEDFKETLMGLCKSIVDER